jgi:succinate dehydrogenase / fumarate reductase iron-sulfur subunit
MKLKVFRYQAGMEKPRYDVFTFEPVPGMSVLSGLFHVQEKFDDSLAFRYSCRGAVCGTCAMLINRVPRLACRTQLGALIEGKLNIPLHDYVLPQYTEPWDPSAEVIVEPLPNLPVIRDLIVDMTTFFANYRAIDPVFHPPDSTPEKERLMSPAAVRELGKYTTCILCAACFGACPVNARNPHYLGPAALAKLWRFRIDPREEEGMERLGLAEGPDGWGACEFHTNCRRVCPKDVPPDVAIGHARMEINKMRKEPPKREREREIELSGNSGGTYGEKS